MERSVLSTMNEALDVLLGIPKSLMRVETASDERQLAGILSALSETYQRMEDLADAYAEVAAIDGSRGRAPGRARPEVLNSSVWLGALDIAGLTFRMKWQESVEGFCSAEH